MLRFSGHCILFFIIASCGGLLVKRNYESQFEFPSQDLSDILESPELRGVRMQPVSIKEFKKLISRTNNYYDFLRIFLNKKNLTNESIDQIVNARTIEKILKGNEGRMLSKRDDEEEEDYDDEMAYSDDVQSRLDEELAEAFHHIDEFESSSLSECKYPQPEVVRVTDEEGRNRVFVPECTILHRCRNVSGCCGNKSRECGPKRIQIIERAFLAVDFVNNDGREVIPGKEMVIKKVFINHTECECRELRGLPSCDRYECPFPFSKKRPNIQCVCDCFESPHEENFRCQGIKEGRAPLDEEALMCIKSGTCLKPECTAGKFDVPSGYCPELPEDKLALQKYDTLATHTHDHPEEMTFNKHGKTAEMDYNKNGNPTKTTSIKDGNPPHKTTTNRGNATETASKKHNKRDKMTSRKNVKHHKTSSNKNVKHRKPSSGEHGRRQKTPSHQHHRHHETPDLNMPKFEPN